MRSSSRQEVLSRRVALLKQVFLFAGLSEAELAALVGDFHPKEYSKDEIIFRQGDTSRELYLVMRGKVRIFRISPSGAETTIAIYSTGSIIGEFAVVDSEPRSATAKAIEAADLLVMSQDKFLHHLRQMPDLALGMTRLLASRVRWTAAYAETIAQYDAAGRLLHILLLYNEQFGQEEEAGRRYVLDLALNQTDLASLVGARREWVNRLLRDWQRRGIVAYEAGKIIILDLPRAQAERDSRIEANVGEAGW
ncbi:MAG: Crp/Fnr family transcriptional regulator [Chloroflexota bacterium]|nr:MAG: Crp/Fnr family transcriptional regulator [Chloroflexota bacterium]